MNEETGCRGHKGKFWEPEKGLKGILPVEVITQMCAFVKIHHIYFKRVKFTADILCPHKDLCCFF